MRLRIFHKIFLAVAVAMIVVVIVALGLSRWSFNRGFVDYINEFEARRLDVVVAELADIWRMDGGFDSLLDDEDRWHELMNQFSSRPIDGRKERAPRKRPPPPGGHRGGPGRGGSPAPAELLDADGNVLFGRPTAGDGAQLRPIEVDAVTVGYLRYVPITEVTELDEKSDREFVAQQLRAAWVIGVAALAIAGLLAVFLARQLVAPIRSLAAGANAIAAGRFDERIDVTSNDELGQLAADFNAMAATLERSLENQRRWVVDIAHELRTPLAILGGELQAIEDGVRRWDDGARASLQAEVERLTGLVDDLGALTLSDAGGLGFRQDSVELRAVVEQAMTRCAGLIADRELTLESELPAEVVYVSGDRDRLEQMVVNLIENSCRYTDAGGKLRVHLEAADGVRIVIEDSAPGVPAGALPKLFDRLYRVDASRSRTSGGSGLGLAICKGIVEAHGGRISASSSALGGLRIEVELPYERG